MIGQILAHLVLLGLATGGFMLLCAANPRHQQALLHRRLTAGTARRLYLGGWAAFGAAVPVAWSAYGAATGTVVLFGFATVGAAITVALANRRKA
ncbi:DUF3325 domain-containing protein [Sphingomonas sanxanigenens]|uniref:DUF3325 domain-containing protein n=1 Tax=Sphingomonas sanxanigenens DSM 19645 = NX02 TaxID=1123269 RepID=W0A5C8_9SPHN|nr:DUF3325 domain-containing protein [Sphingomonas sanxanigenens]AHE53154.1 hypothetical protein NX02_07135 [Sphingomonas sanxanigenens DSM 19645 = NX02]